VVFATIPVVELGTAAAASAVTTAIAAPGVETAATEAK
jgi:hypothetical protein